MVRWRRSSAPAGSGGTVVSAHYNHGGDAMVRALVLTWVLVLLVLMMGLMVMLTRVCCRSRLS